MTTDWSETIHGTDRATWENFLIHARKYATQHGHKGPNDRSWKKFLDNPGESTSYYYCYRAYWELKHLLSPKLQRRLLVTMTKARLGITPDD